VLVLTLLVACAPVERVELPRKADGTLPATLVFLDVPDPTTPDGVTGEIIRGKVVELAPYAPRSRPAIVLFYDAAPEELGLVPGPIAHNANAQGSLVFPDEALPDLSVLGDRALRDLSFDGAACTGCFEGGYCHVPCAGEQVDLPAPPALPAFGACPDGLARQTREIAGSMVEYCGGVSRASCGTDTRATIDGSCVPVRPTCPASTDRWAQPPPGSDPFYAAPGAVGGDGSRARPFTFAEALAAALPNSVIMLSEGMHDAPNVRASVRLIGACAGTTTIASSVLVEAGETLVLEGLSLVPATTLVVRGALEIDGAVLAVDATIEAGGTVRGQRSLIAGSLNWSIHGTVDWDDCELRRTEMEVDGGHLIARRVRSDAALRFRAASTGSVSASVLVGDTGTAVQVEDAQVSLASVVFLGGRWGVKATSGSTVAISRASFVSQVMGGDAIRVDGRSRVTVRDAVIVDAPAGITTDGPMIVALERVALDAISGVAISCVSDPENGVLGSTLDDILVSRTSGGIHIAGNVRVRRARVRDGDDLGLQIEATGREDSETSAVLDDIEIQGSIGAAIEIRGQTGQAINVVGRRLHVLDTQGVGISLREGTGKISLEHVQVTNTVVAAERPPSCRERNVCRGVGLAIHSGVSAATLDVARFAIDGASAAGIVLGPEEVSLGRGEVRGAPSCMVVPAFDADRAPYEWLPRLERVRLECLRLFEVLR